MAILVVAEHGEGKVNAVTFNTAAAAQQIGSQLGDAEIHFMVIGYRCDAVAEALARVEGMSRVRKVDGPHYAEQLVENLAMVVAQTAGAYSHVLLPATTFGKALAPRVAAMLDVAQVSDIVAVETADIFVRPIYAGNALARVQSTDPVKIVTVRAAAFPPAKVADTSVAQIDNSPGGPDMGVSRFIERVAADSSRPDLATARVVVAGGRGLGSRENFQTLLGPLADRLGGAIGATRAAVDANYVANDAQVGQTGKVVAPDLYIAIGISGSLQHLAGMQNSKVIVAINKDAEAPIFQVADYGLVGDLNEIVPRLTAALPD